MMDIAATQQECRLGEKFTNLFQLLEPQKSYVFNPWCLYFCRTCHIFHYTCFPA